MADDVLCYQGNLNVTLLGNGPDKAMTFVRAVARSRQGNLQ